MQVKVDVPVESSFDVIVVGGGPAGCAAAASAARDGAKTLLLEGTGQLGGMGTAGLVPAWTPFTNGKERVYRGLASKVFDAACKGNVYAKSARYEWGYPINQEALKRVYDSIVLGSGAKVLFFSSVCGVERAADGSVDSVLVANKRGLSAFKSKVFIDCSGDADVAAWAGAKVEKGDPKTGDMMLSTLCALVSNVDEGAYLNGHGLDAANKESPIYQILKSKRFPRIKDIHSFAIMVGPGTMGFNAGHLWDIDGTDPESLSAGMAEGRLQVEEIVRALSEFYPKAFANAHLATTASLMGIRETRRVAGDYVMTTDDYWARRSFPDEIARNCYWLDTHTPIRDEKKLAEDNANHASNFKPSGYAAGESHGIPYRALAVKGISNLLAAGRCMSCERDMLATLRVMPVGLVTGEAAGAAAALAAASGSNDVHKIDVDELRRRLKAAGAFFE